MKKAHTDEQIVGIMRGYEGSGETVKEYCRTKGIHETTYYAWKKAVRDDGSGRGEGAEEPAGGEREIEAAFGGA